MLRCLREHAGLFNTFIEATCGIGHWYSAKHVCYDDSLSRNEKLEGRGEFGMDRFFFLFITCDFTPEKLFRKSL